jgi:hypothetical protein
MDKLKDKGAHPCGLLSRQYGIVISDCQQKPEIYCYLPETGDRPERFAHASNMNLND